MTPTETAVVCVAVVSATVAAIFGTLTPELSGLLGVAIGYGGKGAVTAVKQGRKMTELQLANDMRVGCLGRTGSGKTVLMEKLLADQPRVIVVDDKHRVNFPGYHLTSDPAAALLEPKTIFRPEDSVPPQFWEDVMTTLHKAGGGILYIDELSEQCTPNSMPEGLKTILRMGRELGVGLWFSAQSATEIFNTAIRQSDVLILFLNVGASDRDKIIKTAGDIGEVTAHLQLYQFVVFESANQAYDPNAIPAYKLNLTPAVV